MSRKLIPLLLGLGACTLAPPRALDPQPTGGRPLDTLPAGADLTTSRQDLLATASDRFGAQTLGQARSARAFLIAKRFVGMPPPPPKDAGPDWVPPTPTALLMRGSDGWLVATAAGWRPAKAVAAAELDSIFSNPRFWSEPPYIPPCPDYGASLLLLKLPGKAKTMRKSGCSSVAEKAVFAALGA